MPYIVPDEIPKYCNKCPFGVLHHSLPLTSKNKVFGNWHDGSRIFGGTHGYNCNLDFLENGKYEKIAIEDCEKDIKRPEWCRLISVDNE